MKDTDLFGEPVKPNPTGGALARAFMLPPFSVLNAREGWWQERKRAWLALGIKSELGRGSNIQDHHGACEQYRQNAGDYAKTYNSGGPGDLNRQLRAIPGGGTGANSAYMFKTADGYEAGEEAQQQGTDTSVFDPVLCELALRWFCPPGGTVVDPFAGGSVRGIVASALGHYYHGVELRPEQVEANREQAAAICVSHWPSWYVGDSRHIGGVLPGVQADFVFSCPPYGDLERYSDDPRDLSTLDYTEFRKAYGQVIYETAALLKPNRFAAFAVGDFRSKQGHYRAFPWHTVEAFEAAGLHYYNEAVLVTAVGSLPVRTGKQFDVGRKLGKSHQQLMVFVKGDWRKAAAACNGNAPEPEPEPDAEAQADGVALF